ncbi:MAG: HAD-IIIA family hydrolase [Cephaloticoccus sp.]|nr:HAD-IIIA family hydrolase [Cephaloticoccus sp.]MCF7760456.1 HAD-IIIA family hydrolase [Cephaloticoccus sp.]
MPSSKSWWPGWSDQPRSLPITPPHFDPQPISTVPKIGQRKPAISKSHWAGIRLFAMDVDGVLTDGTVQIASDGTESKVFSILDGMGIVRLNRREIAVAWISGRPSEATTRRAAELKVPHLIQGRTDKLTALQELADRLHLPPSACVYMGDDDIDAPAIAWAGIGVSVPDAMPAALQAARYITTRTAGRGAVREICEHILARRGPTAKS